MSKKFSELSAAGKRVRIAKDVLQWLASKKLTAMSGEYIKVLDSDGLEKYPAKKVNGFNCEACALGAIFACAVERKPRLAGGNLIRFGGAIHSQLRSVFDREQLLLIENAFEQCDIHYDTQDNEANRRAITFSKSTDDKKRMKCIMQNIIDNKGTFIP